MSITGDGLRGGSFRFVAQLTRSHSWTRRNIGVDFQQDRRLLGVHCFGDIASELVGIGQMVIHFNGTIDTFLQVTLNTPSTLMPTSMAIEGILKLDNFKKQKH